MLEVDAVAVSLGDQRVLHDISLKVGRDETVAVLGPSGCGKTTLLRVIAGLQVVTGGSVRIDGADQGGVPPHHRDVGLMFQEHALFPHRDVSGNVEFGLRMRRVPPRARAERVRDVLELVGLGGFEARSVSELSGGERQRVALARSLAPRPKVLMLDEPLGSLDRSLRDRLVVELRELFTSLGLTVVYVTHDQSEALALADRVAVVDAGRIVQDAPPTEVWNRPASPFVAGFLGFTNLVPVETRDGVVRSGFGPLASALRTDGASSALRTDGASSALRTDGATGLALIRPTAISVGRGGLRARVRSVSFAGDHSAVELEMGDGSRLDASLTGPPPSVGESLAVELDPDGIQLFPAPPHPDDGTASVASVDATAPRSGTDRVGTTQ